MNGLSRRAAILAIAAASLLPAPAVAAEGSVWRLVRETGELIVGVPLMTTVSLFAVPAVAVGELVGIGRDPGHFDSAVDHLRDGWGRTFSFDTPSEPEPRYLGWE